MPEGGLCDMDFNVMIFFRDKALFSRLTAHMSLRQLTALLDSETRAHRQLFFQWLDESEAFAAAVVSRYGARNRDDVRDAMCIVALYYDYLRVSNALHCRPLNTVMNKENVIRDKTRAAAKAGHVLTVKTAVALPIEHSITLLVDDALKYADVVQLLLPMMTVPALELWIDYVLKNNYLDTLDVLLRYTSEHDQLRRFIENYMLFVCLRTKNYDAARIVLRYYSLDDDWHPSIIQVFIKNKPERAAFLVKYMSEDTLRAVRDEMTKGTDVWRILDEEIQQRTRMDTKRLRAPIIGLPVFSEDRALFFNQLLQWFTLH